MQSKKPPRLTLPDFSALFFSSFANQEQGVRFQVRQGAELRHDLQFLSSLIHDAEIDLFHCKQRKGRFTFDMERSRWELYDRASESPCIPAITSKLIIGPVHATTVSYSDRIPCQELPSILTIFSIESQGYYAVDDPESWTLTFNGKGMQVAFVLPVFGFTIELIDRYGDIEIQATATK